MPAPALRVSLNRSKVLFSLEESLETLISTTEDPPSYQTSPIKVLVPAPALKLSLNALNVLLSPAWLETVM